MGRLYNARAIYPKKIGLDKVILYYARQNGILAFDKYYLKKLSMRFLLIILGLVLIVPAWAQKLDMDKLKGLTPRAIGPAGMSGRITAIDAVVSNPDIIYAGAASGGVWLSTSGGVSWEPIFDKEATLSIGAIAIQQDNPAVVWVGTGEGNPRNSLNGGYGIYKTLDGGKTWKMMGL